MSLRIYKKHVLSLFCMTVATFPAIAQTDSLFLTIDQLFERGVRHSLQIQADVLKESIAQERTHTAQTYGTFRTIARPANRLERWICRATDPL